MPRCKLTQETVDRIIRAKAQNPEQSAYTLAKRFGLSHTTVIGVLKGILKPTLAESGNMLTRKKPLKEPK